MFELVASQAEAYLDIHSMKHLRVLQISPPNPLWAITASGLQITVGHRTMADQYLSTADEISTLVGHFDRPIFCGNIWVYHLQIKFDFLVRSSFKWSSVFMSDQIFLLSDQNGALVGHMSFQGKKFICSPAALHPALNSPVPVYTPWWRESRWE